MEILNICMNKECRVWTIKDNYRLGDDIQNKVLAFAFGLSAEIERNLNSHPLKTIFQHKACTDKLYADSFYKVQKNSHSSFEVICCRR